MSWNYFAERKPSPFYTNLKTKWSFGDNYLHWQFRIWSKKKTPSTRRQGYTTLNLHDNERSNWWCLGSLVSRSTQEFKWLAWNYLYCWSFSEQPAISKAVQMTTWWRIRNMGMFSICLASPTFWARRNICDKRDTRKRRSTLNKVGNTNRDES